MATKSADWWKPLVPPQTDEQRYRAAFKNSVWSIPQFAALAASLDPETFDQGKSLELSKREYKRRYAHAREILRQFFDDFEKGMWREKDFICVQDTVYMSAWRYIKWIAERKISVSNLFYDNLPFELGELLMEFGSMNSELRTTSSANRRHHRALYLQHAQQLLNRSSRALTSKEIYQDPHMQDVQRYIRKLGGRYKKRTFLESWLPQLILRKRGRPKKPT